MGEGNSASIVNGRISAIVERRGKREDKNLMSYYQQLLEKGTYWVTAERIKNRMLCLYFKWKSEDIAGLQIADLIAYPLTRHVLNPQAVNLAYFYYYLLLLQFLYNQWVYNQWFFL